MGHSGNNLQYGKDIFSYIQSKGNVNELIDVFASFLSNGDNAKYVDSIVISGHTDSTGTAETNRTLSTQRANSVLNYMLLGKNGKLDRYSSYFCAAGYGATRPVDSNETDAGRAANRRIEISMILKDDTVLEIVEQYLAIQVPDSKLTPNRTAQAQPDVSPTPVPSPSPTPKSRFSFFGG